MDKTAIKNFAVWARVKLMEDIRTRLGLLGITEDGISDPLPASTNEVKYFDIGADHPVSIKGKAIHQREQLAGEIQKAGKESNYQSAYRNFIESSAYDWFNRLIAIRYMEVNEYAPLDVRLLSSVEPGKQDPDLVSTPFDGSLEYSEPETQQILAWKEQHDNNKLFRFLLFKMCNQLHDVLPGIFEARDDASELLMRQSFIDKDGIIHHLVNDISEEKWKDQVQIIGWIYQYYNSELKAEVFAKKEKVTKDELPAVTQLFTPDWIVRYMVENSLGRLWIEHLRGLDPDVDEKETAEKFGWKYYLPEAKQEPEVEQQLAKIREEYATLKPEDLSCADICMGSGHILVYMFDVLEQIYTSVGYSEREAAKAILENNIYGLDIDDRAYQLAYFAVMMKARQYNRRILTSGIKAHVYSIQESNGITKNQLQEMGENLSPDEKSKALSQAEKLVELFHDAKEYGSILNIPEMDWELLRRFATPEEKMGQTSLNWNQEASERLMQLIDQGEVMAQKYCEVCTNPPYAALSGLNAKVGKYIKDYYPDSKADLFAVFIERCNSMLQPKAYQAMITQHAWMFLSSYEKLRKKMLLKTTVNMVHLGARAFEEIGGEVVQTTSFVLMNITIQNYKGKYIRAIKPNSQDGKEQLFLANNNVFIASQKDFLNIPGRPIAYWISKETMDVYREKCVEDAGSTRKGMATGWNEEFVRAWYEVPFDNIGFGLSRDEAAETEYKWFPYANGGEYRKWYGDNVDVVLWENDGYRLQNEKTNDGKRIRAVNLNLEYIFKAGIVWNSITSRRNSFRLLEKGFLFSSASNAWFGTDLYYILALLNSKVAGYLKQIKNPTLNANPRDIGSIPLIAVKKDEVEELCLNNIELCKEDWDSFETSWNYKRHPFNISTTKIQDAFSTWKEECEERFIKLKNNEERLNSIFINGYHLQNDLNPEVSEDEVSIHKADIHRCFLQPLNTESCRNFL